MTDRCSNQIYRNKSLCLKYEKIEPLETRIYDLSMNGALIGPLQVSVTDLNESITYIKFDGTFITSVTTSGPISFNIPDESLSGPPTTTDQHSVGLCLYGPIGNGTQICTDIFWDVQGPGNGVNVRIRPADGSNIFTFGNELALFKGTYIFSKMLP